MKKPILLIISNNSYFQPSFLNNVCRVISKTNYYVERVLVLNTVRKLTTQKYLLNNFFRLYPSEIFKLTLLKIYPNLINFFLREKIKNFSILDIVKKNKLIHNFNLDISDGKILKLIKKKNYAFIINTGDQIFNEKIIKASKNKIFNIHLSLLPKYAGVWTMFQQMSDNEKYTGVTIHKINNYLDSGEIIIQKKIILNKKHTLFENQLKCYKLIPDMIFKSINTNFKSIRKIKKKKLYNYPNINDWKKFRSKNGKII